ncbi:MAG: VanW family protein, partial [Armatimonadetes bacterium]|nr:VanW family protein [Armatimonadota bacterium]
MRKFIIFGLTGVGLLAGAFAGVLALMPPKTPPGLTLEGTGLAGLTRSELRTRLEEWWSRKKEERLTPHCANLAEPPLPMSLSRLGVRPDWNATLAGVRFESALESLLGRSAEAGKVRIVWATGTADLGRLEQFITENALAPRPASVRYDGGRVVREPEITPFRLASARVSVAAARAVEAGLTEFDLPIEAEPPRIASDVLDRITDVIGEFTTKFNAGNRNRSGNIRIAAERLNGQILLPGETLSFNETVGRRTQSAGFRLAGIYSKGRHEVGIGGGICQVSGTLFNAALLANMEIVSRRSHSMPVPYLSIGRDATVDFGSVDIAVRNNSDSPLAIVSEVDGGTLTFRVLGRKDPEVEVSVITTDHSSWGHSLTYVDDPSVEPGTEKIIEKGSTGRRCVTWRIVRRNGEEVSRENLGVSYYRAWPKIVARRDGVAAAFDDDLFVMPPLDPPP